LPARARRVERARAGADDRGGGRARAQRDGVSNQSSRSASRAMTHWASGSVTIASWRISPSRTRSRTRWVGSPMLLCMSASWRDSACARCSHSS
ncbi:MAG: hypothetical protein ACK56I_01335, partial [bacterium]